MNLTVNILPFLSYSLFVSIVQQQLLIILEPFQLPALLKNGERSSPLLAVVDMDDQNTPASHKSIKTNLS